MVNIAGTNTPGPSSHIVTTTVEGFKTYMSSNFSYSPYGSGVNTPNNYSSPTETIVYVLRFEHINT